MTYQQIQLTNQAVGTVAVDAFIPYGTVTRRINAPVNTCNTFTLAESNPDTITLNSAGFYKVTYSLTAEAAEVGNVTVTLVVNGVDVYTVSQYVSDVTGLASITLPYTIRACTTSTIPQQVLPVTVQIKNAGVALTGSTSSIIVEKL